jgi:TetR/AcrR family transcriptional regulator, ethionamide resistance regulator
VAHVPQRRRRRSPEAAVAEILQAAEDFLRERPFRELSVDEVMARTSLSRSSFYVYFRDRHDLLLRLIEEIGDALMQMADRWLTGTGDPRADARDALAGLSAVYSEHGIVMRAIADAARVDSQVEHFYEDLIDRFVVANTAHIAEEIAAGRAPPMDPGETARALVWASEAYLVRTLGTVPPRQPREQVVETLSAIWVRVLYGE